MNDNLLEIKRLFEKVYSAYVYGCRFSRKENEELWEEKITPLVEKYYERLEELGVDREFTMRLFIFGIDGLTAIRSWKNLKPLKTE
jgi:hypothetical protein